MFRALFAYQRGADRLAEWTGLLSKWVVIPTVAVGFANVLLRYTSRFAGTRLTNNMMIELQWHLYSLIFLLGFAYILKHQINVRVDFWFAHQPPKRKAMIDFVGHIIALIPFCLIAIWISVPQVVTSWDLMERSPDPSGIIRPPIKTMIPIAFVLLLIQALAEMVKLYAVLTDRIDARAIEGDEQPIRIE